MESTLPWRLAEVPAERTFVDAAGGWSAFAIARNAPSHGERASRGALDLALVHASGRARVHTACAAGGGLLHLVLDGRASAFRCWGCLRVELARAGVAPPCVTWVTEAEALWVVAALVGVVGRVRGAHPR
ncbi:MAG: hypothetical protein H6736_10680 [Alphaproteobacteria bacterium]|nr:hypothetical protein [Alphaproteobacteria bacterium]